MRDDTPKNLKDIYSALLAYAENTKLQDYYSVVVYTLSDGSYRFSPIDAIDMVERVALESALSDRLLLIVSVAYLEDQLRILLRKFLADVKVSEELLNPSISSIAALVPMANMALALGLIAKDWHEILKHLGQLRNKFAHIPSASSIDDLVDIDKKSIGVMQNLAARYRAFVSNETEETKDFRRVCLNLFTAIYCLLQFSIDHIVPVDSRQQLDNNKVQAITHFHGLTIDTLRQLVEK
jgi:hypothetical protein